MLECLNNIQRLCRHPKHGISAVIVVRQVSKKAHFLISQPFTDMNYVNPFMALVAQSVNQFRGMQVNEHGPRLREAPLKRHKAFVYDSEEEKQGHVNRLRQVIDCLRQLTELPLDFYYILVEIPPDVLDHPTGFEHAVQGVPETMVGLLGIEAILQERLGA